MTHEEATAKSMTVRWKTSTCLSGEECWCRIIEPEEPIFYTATTLPDGDDEELYIAGSGCVPTEYAEHIVKLHNQSLGDKVLMPKTLTAENGSKGLMNGEFRESIDLYDPEEGDYEQEVPIKWTTIKDMYRKLVEYHTK